MKNALFALGLSLLLAVSPASAADTKEDVFRGKLFPPNVILEHQAELALSREQFAAIKAAVVEVQAGVAEYEWDMREAYLRMMSELDKSPIDESAVINQVTAALAAENEVKKHQVTMLIRLRNLLDEEQVAYLQSVTASQ